MVSNIGSLSLILALGVGIFGTLAAFAAALQAKERFRAVAVRSFLAVGLLTLVGVICLGILLQRDDFTNVYVYSHSNAALPTVFKFTALWGGSQGSLLWWTLILNALTAIWLFTARKGPRLMMSWAMVFVGMALVFFLMINNFVANPFNLWMEIKPDHAPQPFLPNDGKGLNPQLQHWAMIIHPPLLYTGYIAFLYPFAMALGALITRMESRDWIRIIRRWTLTAWLILGVGIILGGAWAYMELGWGGYWAWDPVENASFMPWLLASAFIHSVMAQELRGMFKKWNIILLIGTYLMCMFGTFITRSGLISSVHAFAESDIGYYFIGYIAVTAVLCVIVLAMRWDQLKDDNAYESATSREVGFLFNNILFISICVTMLLATVYPMLTEAIEGTKRELRHGFYNTVEIPIFLLLMVLMAIGPLLAWKRTNTSALLKRITVPIILGLLAGGIGVAMQQISHTANISFGVLTFLLATIVQEFWTVSRRRSKRAGENLLVAAVSMVRLNKRRYGGYIAHFGVFLMALGITGAAFNLESKESLGVGESMQVGHHTFQVESIEEFNTDNFFALRGKVNLVQDGAVAETFYPEQRFYHASESQASEVAIAITPKRDYYVVLAGYAEGSTREFPIGVFHIYVNPLVLWIWIGSLFLTLGTVIAMLPNAVREHATASVPSKVEGAQTA